MKRLPLAFLAMAMPLTAWAKVQEVPARVPNVVVILADDLGWGDLGCYPKGAAWGEEAKVATPHLDRLAAGGVRCTQAYAAAMVSAPSRASLLSGRYSQRFGWYGFSECNVGIPKSIPLLPETLSHAGIATGMVGKWHVGYPRGFTPRDRGFAYFFGFLGGQHDYFDPNLGEPTHAVDNAPDAWIYDQDRPVETTLYLTEEFANRAMAFMEPMRHSTQPFFLYLAFNAPHPPLQAPWSDLEPIAEGKRGKLTPRELARAMIQRLDTQVGRMMTWLRESGLESNTLVIFSSDNGGHDDGPGHVVQHNGGLRGRKGYFYEGGIRVPLIASYPGHLPAGAVYHQPITQLDLYPTILAAMGVPAAQWPADLDGLNLLPYLEAKEAGAPHESLFWSLPQGKWAVRQGRWKLVNEDTTPTLQQGKKPTFQTQLYDLEADACEQQDRSAQEPQRVAALQQLIAEFQSRMKPTLYTPSERLKHEAELAERQKHPELNSHPRRDGAPGHWFAH